LRRERDAPVKRNKVIIRVRNLHRRMKIDTRNLRSFIQAVTAEVGPESGSATVALVDDRRMRALNRLFRGLDRATDVLAFPAGPSVAPDDDGYLGDIVISVETAREQAQRRKSTLPRELSVLALHGYLHLLGYDHTTDEGEMRRVEYRLRRKFELTRSRASDAPHPVRKIKRKR
jgi:probable rRNA maturation factor